MSHSDCAVAGWGGRQWGGPGCAGNISNSATGLSRKMYLKEVIASTKTVVYVHVHVHTLYMDMKGGMYLETIIHIWMFTLKCSQIVNTW